MPKVTLLIRIRTADGRQPYCPVVWADTKQKKLKPGWALVDGKPEHHDEGVYHLRYTKAGRRVWENVGKDAVEALKKRNTVEWVLNNPEHVQMLRPDLREQMPAIAPPAPKKITLAEQREQFLERKKLSRTKTGDELDKETLAAHSYVTEEFLSVVGKKYAEEIQDIDLLRWMDALRQRGLSHRTICNYYSNVATFLKFCGIDHKELLDKNERPTPDDGDPGSYTEEEMTKFFAALDNDRDRLYFEFLLKTGCRELEGVFLEWTDIRKEGDGFTVHIRNKREQGFRTKTRKERTIPLERTLYLRLMMWQMKRPGSRYVFGTDADKPNWHFLRVCKATAKRAGLNCGHCDQCKRVKECEHWYLHKFRDTFGTWACRRGVDLRTVQGWMGHSSIAMTERYLEKGKGEYAQSKINLAFGNFSFGQNAMAAD